MADEPIKEGRVGNLAFGGDGIVRDGDLVVFVPYVIPGETISYRITKKKSRFAFGNLVTITSPSNERTEPKCPYFGECNGCQFQHIDYQAQLTYKKQFVQEALERIAKIKPPECELYGCEKPYAYRQHIRLNLEIGPNGFRAGYRVESKLLEIDLCPIFSFEPIMRQMRDFLQNFDTQGIESASLRLFKLDDDKFLAAFSFAPTLPSNRAAAIDQAPAELTSIWLQAPRKREIYRQQTIEFSWNGESYPISPYVFTQNNSEMAKKLYEKTLSLIPQRPHSILDLYCGMGLIADQLAMGGHKVLGVESHPEAIHLAKGRGKAKFLIGAVEELFAEIRARGPFETILINPPREGVHPDVIDMLALLKPKRILYTSCMPSTLARDIARLKGFELTSLAAFDLFPQTTHLETLALLERVS